MPDVLFSGLPARTQALADADIVAIGQVIAAINETRAALLGDLKAYYQTGVTLVDGTRPFTGVQGFVAGTAGAPGAWIGNATTGLFSGDGGSATAWLAVTSNGLQRAYFGGSYTALSSPGHYLNCLSVDMAFASATGYRIQLAGISAAARGPIDVVTAGNADSLRIDETTGTVSSGVAPAAGYQFRATGAGGTAALTGAETSGIGVLGSTQTGSAFWGQTTHGRALLAYQTGSLTSNNTNPCVFITRDLTLGAFDATGQLLYINDSTASTGNLFQIDKQGVAKHYVISNGAYYHAYDGSNRYLRAINSSGFVYNYATGSSPAHLFLIGNDEKARIDATGLRIEASMSASPRSLVDVVAAGNANAFRIDDTLGTAGFGIAPTSVDQLIIQAGTGIVAVRAQSTNAAAIVGTSTDSFGVYASSGSGYGAYIVSTSGASVQALEAVGVALPFTNYVGTSAADATKSISTLTVATIAGYTRDSINGVDQWRPFYNAPTA